ncbi:MAG TPA: transcriptional regulator [Bacteroidales bacterium]|nr:transcriptional regulator [Bacteroidales bacterium]
METVDYQDISLKLAPMLDVLSHPARLQIVLHLAKYNGCPAGSISERLPLSKSTVSQHLSKLKELGIITATPDGQCQRYSLNEKAMNELNEYYHSFITTISELSKAKIDCPGSCNC